MSPETYAMQFEDAPFEELLKERSRLIKEMKGFEKMVMRDEAKGPEWMIMPSPDTVYQMELEYLAKLCPLIAERYRAEYGD